MASEAAAEARGEPNAQAQPSRLWGRIWTHAEVAERIAAVPPTPEVPPAHWPANVRVDASRWASWLPEGWGQCVKVTAGGKDCKCFVNPEGKLYYHKSDIEKALGQQFTKRDGSEEAAEDPDADIDAAPQRWPERLPTNWRTAVRRLSSGKHRCFIAPAEEGQEDFYFWHMKDVEAFLSGARSTRGVLLNRADRYDAARHQSRQQAAEQPLAETPPAKRQRSRTDEGEAAAGKEPPEGAGSATKRPREGPTLSSLWASRMASAKPLGAQAGCTMVDVSDSEAEDSCGPQPVASAPPAGAPGLLSSGRIVDVEDIPPAAPAVAPDRQPVAVNGAIAAAVPPPIAVDGPAAAAAPPPAARAEDAPPKPTRRMSFTRRPSTVGVEAAPPASITAGMSPASLEEFFQFLQCQVSMEAREILGEHVEPQDPGAKALWQDYEAFVTPNLGATERWVPYHTALGVHEFFLIESVHHRQEPLWHDKRRFLAIFIFRAHCKRDFFNQAQLPHLLREEFWSDPVGAFAPEGVLEQSMREYRRRTRQPLLTLAMRMIPERLLPDDDDNLVRSIVLRTQRLLEVAEQIWPVIQDAHKPAGQRFTEISQLVQTASGLGETWAKMLSVCLDLAYPHLGLLASQCDVGVGAQAPLRALLGEDGLDEEPKEALALLQRQLNSSSAPSSNHFWALLPKVEELVRRRHQGLPLILEQVRTERGKMSAVTLQVQLCEYRQFRNSIAKLRFGLPGDDSLKVPERPKRLKHEDHLEFDEAGQRLLLNMPAQEGQPQQQQQQPQQASQEPLEVALAAVGGRRRLAERVALLCFEKLRDGASRDEAVTFREELCKQCKGFSEDAPDDCEAWLRCKVQLKHPSPLVSFVFQVQGGAKVPFQTTVKAAGSVMNAERIARLCYVRFEEGATKEAVLGYRAELYRRGVAPQGSLFR